MIRTTLNWNVSKIQNLYEKNETLSFSHPIQRSSNIWEPAQKALLIDSMLRDYLIPAVVILKQDNLDSKTKQKFSYYVIDGKQRLTNAIDYLDGEYPLTDDLPPVTIDEEKYEIAGKYFCELAEPVQYEIKRYKFQLVCFENCTDEEIEQIFYRLNNGSCLSKSQKSKAIAGIGISSLINELLSSKFFSQICFFTDKQKKNSDDQKALFQSMMLLDRNYISGFEFQDFSEKSIEIYAKNIHDNYSDKQIDTIRSAIEFLSDAFTEKNKNLKKVMVPTLVYTADYAIDQEISLRQFGKWLSYFTTKDEFYADFKLFGGTGSTKLEKVDSRLALMLKSFCKYNKLEIPSELTDIVVKTDKFLEERKAMLAGVENTSVSEQTEKDTNIVDQVGNDSLIVEEESETSDTSEQEESENETVLPETSTNETDNAEQEETTASEEETDNADSAEEEIFKEENLQNAE